MMFWFVVPAIQARLSVSVRQYPAARLAQLEVGVAVGGIGVLVAVGGIGVFVAVGGTGVFVAVGGTGVLVAVGGTGVFVAVGPVGVFVAVGGTGVLVGVGGTGVLVAVGGTAVLVGVAVGTTPPHDGNLKAPIRVFQGAEPVLGIYSVVIQKVQSSTGSTEIMA